MPSGRVHWKDAKYYNYNNFVNQFMDVPFLWLGNKHRVLFHTPKEAMKIGYMIDGIDGAFGAHRHIWIDNIKEKEIKNLYELMATTNNYPKRSKERFFTINMTPKNHDSKKPNRARGEIISVRLVPPKTDKIMHLGGLIIKYLFTS